MYEIIEISLANLSRLYRYKLEDTFKADFNIKGFDTPWVVTSHPWHEGERVLDVGAAYSPLPRYLNQKYGCEMWAVDDFGMEAGDEFWLRSRSPDDFIAQNPQVRYVLERLGDTGNSSLPLNYFDVIYSISVLEHVPGSLQVAVWLHMDALLKPGGVLLHAVDIDFPSNFGLSGLMKVMGFERLFYLLPVSIREKYFLVTPRSYLKHSLPSLNIPPWKVPRFSSIKMAMDPDILTEEVSFVLNRMQKDGTKDVRYRRFGSLLIHLKKLN